MRIILTLLSMLALGPVRAQDAGDLKFIRSVPGEFSAFTADVLGNLYTVSNENQLKKTGPGGDSMGVFNDVRRYGKLSSIDVTNPLKAILFYRDYRTVVVLDRFLNPVNTIDLRKQNIFQVRAVCASYDNNIWVFDEQESKLKKVAEDGRTLSETNDLRQAMDDPPMPVALFDQDGYVYAYDPARGMFVFDYFGTLKSRLPQLQWKDVQVIGKTILGRQDGKLMSHAENNPVDQSFPLPPSLRDAEHVRLMRQGIYVLDPGGVKQYAWQ
jgi:hypothetical protein